MRPSDFDEYHIEDEGEGEDEENEGNEVNDMTFCLKEFRAVIAFADAFKLDIDAKFHNPGR